MLKKILSIALAVIMAAALVGCKSEGNEPAAEQQPAKDGEVYMNKPGVAVPLSVHVSDESIIDSAEYNVKYTGCNQEFSVRMLKAMDPGKNVIFSPLSLQIALQILANGGDEETMNVLLSEVVPGMTREEVNVSSARLIASLMESKGVNINSAVIINDALRLNQKFANTAADYYRAACGALDFSDPVAALNEINGWVKENTHGLIEKLLDEDEIGADTAIVILNALTLELNWAEPFTAMRGLSTFYGLNGEEHIGMIRSTNEYAYGSFDEGSMAIIPYEGGEYAMAVILPVKELTPCDAVEALLPRINDCTPSAVFVEMPKVELDNKHDVLAMADKLGIKDGVYGGFTQLTPDSLVAVSSIVQGATLSVTEQGTVASAATAVVGVKGGAMIAENELICNRPYAMVIYHVETGSVLFVSVVNDVG